MDLILAMTKSKKRRRIDQVSHLSNLTGLEGIAESTKALDECMAELQSQKHHKDNELHAKAACEPSWLRQHSCRTLEEIDLWNRSFRRWANGSSTTIHRSKVERSYPPGLLPSIDEELARNFKVKELSSFLLNHFPGSDLRMPVFERWLLDSKLEEELSDSSSSTVGVTGSSMTKDPILPRHASPASEASQRLLAEVMAKSCLKEGKQVTGRCRIERKDADQAIAELCRKSNLSCQELLSQRERYRRQSPLKKGDRIEIEGDSTQSKDVVTIIYCRKKWKKPFCFKLNLQHYESLKCRFLDIHESVKRKSSPELLPDASLSWPPSSLSENNTNTNHPMLERSFLVIVLALLLRYSALSGGQLLDDLRGGGMQGAIHPEVFEILRNHFCNNSTLAGLESWLEGFASPFNATLPRFASAFPDLDWHFGAVGSFFDCKFDVASTNINSSFVHEYCEANPPFSIGIMEAMSTHINKVFSQAEDGNRKLTFVVIVPSAGDAIKKSSKGSKGFSLPLDKALSLPLEEEHAVVKQAAYRSFQEIVSSKYCTMHIQLEARQHGYVEGSQHLRPTMFKTSSYDTSVVILQSPKAKTPPSGMKRLELDIRKAFASRHEKELLSRRKFNS
jgi:hypothetical protein